MFKARVASAGVGGTLTVRADSPTGPVAGTVQVAPTGGWETWVDVTGTITPAVRDAPAVPGVHRWRGSLFDIDDFTFTSGTTQPPSDEPGVEQAGDGVERGGGQHTRPRPRWTGRLTTRWASAFTDPQWIQVDLGQSYTIDRVS